MGRGTKRNFVLLPGWVKGMGREAECQVLARTSSGYTRISAPPLQYADFSVLDAPADLPGGNYKLYFDGYSAVVKRHHGQWLPCESAVKDAETSVV